MLEAELRQQHPNVAQNYVVCSDTVGSVFTASPLGGLVLIAGTGSNALLSNPDGQTFSCGGWGNMLADEGSAWWIAHLAIKTVFDHEDNLVQSPYDISTVWRLTQEHFAVETRADLLEHCYARFQKCFFAKLCEKLAAEADASGDPLCVHVFSEAGRYLAKATRALLPRVSPDLTKNGSLSIVCVGSVWNSWHLLRDGYMTEIARHSSMMSGYGLKMVRLKQLMALGAVYIGVDAIGERMPRDYAKNFECFQEYLPAEKVTRTNGIH